MTPAAVTRANAKSNLFDKKARPVTTTAAPAVSCRHAAAAGSERSDNLVIKNQVCCHWLSGCVLKLHFAVRQTIRPINRLQGRLSCAACDELSCVCVSHDRSSSTVRRATCRFSLSQNPSSGGLFISNATGFLTAHRQQNKCHLLSLIGPTLWTEASLDAVSAVLYGSSH